MTHRLPAVLSTADLPGAELCAASLDGELVPLAGCFTVVDLPEQAASRARALATGLTGRVIIERLSAAWVFGATSDPPTPPQFCSAADARAKPATLRRLTVREVVIDDDETVMLDGIRVTSPLRTACDLVRSSEDFDLARQLVVLRLLGLCHASVDECITLLDRRRNLPGKKRTLARLRSLTVPGAPQSASAVADPVDVVHGVDTAHRVQDAVQVGGVAHLEHELADRQAVG